MTAAFTFPGQGSQVVGMGKALAEAFPAARAVFNEVDAALGEKLTAIIWDGPAETLQLTENAQPALMAVSLATLRVLETEAGFSVGRDAAFVAGHSLGEYSALAAAGSLSISDTARLLRTRGLAMQKAVPVGVGAMAALLGLDYEAAVAVANEAAQGQVCQAANDNGGGQVVVSGDKAAVERALEIAKTKGAKRAMLLPVSAPFHCRLMQPAADVMAKALADVTIKPPASPVVSNVLAAPITDPDEIRRRLIEQVTGTVRWRESVAYMAGHGVTRFFEIGAGKVLSGLVKRIADGAVGISVGGPNDLPGAKEALAAARTACRGGTMMFDLTGRTALVTGATGGIGSAIAQALHAQGATVAMSGTRREVLDTLAGKLVERVHVLPCNLSDAAEVEALVPAAEQAMGQVDILVANAGITRDNLFVQLRDEDWDEVIKVNLTATFRLARAATKLMMRKRFGRIIAITSIVGVTGNPGQGNYTASKAGLIGMIKTLGAEYAKRNVTANCIAPGFIKTPMTDALNDKQREAILSKVPAARLGTPEDIAAAAVYLASNEAAYVTGQTIHVNGGMAMI
jgi:[acyl-carrier-protein] S-malonyltransferase